MLKAGEARCAITHMNGMTVLGYVSHNGKKNGEEPNDKPRKDMSINTRSVYLLGFIFLILHASPGCHPVA